MELKARQDFYTIPDNISKYNLLTYQTQCPTELKHLLKFWFIITAFDLSLIIISSIENTAVKNIARSPKYKIPILYVNNNCKCYYRVAYALKTANSIKVLSKPRLNDEHERNKVPASGDYKNTKVELYL